jgi:release factor glutamine methyltransferase
MTLREVLNQAAGRLGSVSDTPRLDAELLMAHALGIERETLLLRHLDATPPEEFAHLLARRLAHEPLAYITGTRDFWTISLHVAPGVLIPRPDSETLIEAAVAYFGKAGPETVLDLGTGSGALLLAVLAEWPRAKGLGVDASPEALAIAQGNATRLGMADRAAFHLGNWANGLNTRFDLILCNPPYVGTGEDLPPQVRGYEPACALFAGADALGDYRRIVPQLPALLALGGMIAMEIGPTQAESVSALFRASGLRPSTRRDLGSRDRAVVHFSLGIDQKGG